jgi:hypothetical protein
MSVRSIVLTGVPGNASVAHHSLAFKRILCVKRDLYEYDLVQFGQVGRQCRYFPGLGLIAFDPLIPFAATPDDVTTEKVFIYYQT